jgi:hypothetical protein
MRVLAASLLAAATFLPLSAGPASAEGKAAVGKRMEGAALAAAMKARRLTNVSFDKTKLEDVLTYLRVATGWNYVVKRAPILKAGIDLDAVTVTLTLDDVSVSTILEIALEPSGLVAAVEGNIVYVTTKLDAMGKPILRLYAISHITFTLTDFHGPDLDLHPSGYTAPEVVEEVARDDDPLTDPNKIVELVKEIVSEAWDTEGWAISATKQTLTVKAPRAVQRQVAAALREIGSMK